MLESIISSRTRIKLLMKFFLNSTTTSYLRDLESEFGESSNAIRMELNRLEDASLLKSHKQGNKKIFQANKKHPLFADIHSILLKHTGIDRVLERLINEVGGLTSAYLVGHFARGMDYPVIDIVLAGKDMDLDFLYKLINKTEKIINRRIRYLLVDPGSEKELLRSYPEALLLWEKLPDQV
jgi:DNA-binding transcriptional ArsR family regulator